jgi:hypothetical protein
MMAPATRAGIFLPAGSDAEASQHLGRFSCGICLKLHQSKPKNHRTAGITSAFGIKVYPHETA